MTKKHILLIVAFIVFNHHECSALDCYPLQASVTSSAQLISDKESICGLRLNLFVGENKEVTGLDIGLIGLARKSQGIQLNLVNVYNDINGLEIAGLVNFTGIGSINAIQFAPLANLNIHIYKVSHPSDMVGVQLSVLLNCHMGDIKGAQIGIFNYAESMHGLQIGLFNSTHNLHGTQIGLVNHAENAAIPYLPVINAAF